MDYESPNKRALVQLVQKCLNENGEGFIERQQFISFCADLSVSAEELDNVFNELDSDRDGKINVSDFTSTFDQVSGTLGKVGETTDPCNGHMVNGSIDKSMYECQVNALESPMQVIAGQQYISELYYNLTNSNQSDLLELFEKHLASVVKDIKSRAAENQRLEEALKRATKQHARQVNNLDREVEQQMEKLEAKVRQEEKSLSEKKLSDFQWQLESKEKEIGSMNQTIDILQSRLNKETSRPSRKDEMDTITQENRFLRSQVTDSQTAIAVLRSELAEIRSEFVEQSEQLQKEQRVSHDSVQEQENLTRQLQLLHEANQKLHDINDELRGALEAKKITNSPSKVTSEVLTIPGSCNDPGRDMAFTPIRCHSASPSLGFRHPGHRNVPGECCENSLNEDSLFSEIHRASTPYKSDCEEEDEAYGTMSKPTNGQVQKQIQILEDTNKRLSSSNDELRVALKLMSRSGSFRKSKRSSSGSRRIASGSHSDYGSISSRSSRSFSPKKQKRSSTDDLGGEATDESTTYVDDDNVETVSDSTTMNSEPIADLESQVLKTNNNEEEGERYKNKDEKEEKDEDDDEGDEQENDEEEDEEEEDEEEDEEEEEDEDEDEDDDDDDDDDDEDDEDDDDINSTELADLVALASDLTDVSDSDSELEGDCMGQRSFASSTIATMTTESLNLSYSTPERMYKLVLAGDAAVGKSSFILRLCKNRFHSSLNATLGVDFQVKNILVDSKMVALQLWDTAGQERFRSIAKSYFRKVDGVILLYDVTSESSFIHIRDWMRTIEESSHKKVPIILCGNKCDLREECAREGKKVITRENGQRLAKSYDALFIETSAKDGKHVHDACQELARILTSLENQEIEQSGLKLDNRDKEKKKRTCCPS